MSTQKVREYLERAGLGDRIREFDEGATATVELAAQAHGCETGRIAKTMSMMTKDGPIVVVVMGDARLDNRKFKDAFGEKPRFLKGEEVEQYTGHPIGGVCPFALEAGCGVYLDASLKEFEYVYPAAGAPSNSVHISIEELEKATGGRWVDVTKYWEPQE
ncbi:MAG TPA: YbaK/EbsC family protein [Terriglobales bacterium]|nr:YbaK/EbsC family protein [Terriglobales bacterium]